MATKNSNQNRFKYFNPNPKAKVKKNGEPFQWKTGDCVIRAFAGATNRTWLESFDRLTEIARELFDVIDSKRVIEEALKREGFETVRCRKVKKGEKRPTVESLAEETSDYICVFSASLHVVYAEGGYYWDAWECGDYAVYTYWRKKK